MHTKITKQIQRQPIELTPIHKLNSFAGRMRNELIQAKATTNNEKDKQNTTRTSSKEKSLN